MNTFTEEQARVIHKAGEGGVPFTDVLYFLQHYSQNGDGRRVRIVAPKAEFKHRKEGILQTLAGAGPQGMRARELATAMGMKPQSVSVWFAQNPSKVRRIARGLYTVA